MRTIIIIPNITPTSNPRDNPMRTSITGQTPISITSQTFIITSQTHSSIIIIISTNTCTSCTDYWTMICCLITCCTVCGCDRASFTWIVTGYTSGGWRIPDCYVWALAYAGYCVYCLGGSWAGEACWSWWASCTGRMARLTNKITIQVESIHT